LKSKKAYLKDRLGRFRQEKRALGEPESDIDSLVDSMSPGAAEVFFNDFQHFQGWYN